MLCLLGVGTLQQEAGRASIPEVSANELALEFVELEYRESGRVRVSLRGPLAGPKFFRSGIRDHRQIDGRDRSAKAGVRHMAERAGPIPEGGHVLVEIHQLAEYSICVISGALKCWRLTCQSRKWQGEKLFESLKEDALNFEPNPGYLRYQIGRENARRIRVVKRGYHLIGLYLRLHLLRLGPVWGYLCGLRERDNDEERHHHATH